MPDTYRDSPNCMRTDSPPRGDAAAVKAISAAQTLTVNASERSCRRATAPRGTHHEWPATSPLRQRPHQPVADSRHHRAIVSRARCGSMAPRSSTAPRGPADRGGPPPLEHRTPPLRASPRRRHALAATPWRLPVMPTQRGGSVLGAEDPCAAAELAPPGPRCPPGGGWLNNAGRRAGRCRRAEIDERVSFTRTCAPVREFRRDRGAGGSQNLTRAFADSHGCLLLRTAAQEFDRNPRPGPGPAQRAQQILDRAHRIVTHLGDHITGP